MLKSKEQKHENEKAKGCVEAYFVVPVHICSDNAHQ